MPLWKQAMLARAGRFSAPADGEHGSDTGGTGAGDDNDDDGADDKGDDKGDKDDKSDKGDKGDKKDSKPSDAEAKLLKENMQKKAALKKATDELAAAKVALAKFDGLDADELKELVKAKKDAEEAAALAKGDFESIKKRMAAEHASVIAAKDTELTTVKGQLESLTKQIEELTVGQSFSNSKFITDETVYTPSKMRKLYGDHFEVVDGQVVGYDKPRGATNRTAYVDQYGNHLSFEAVMGKLVEADPDKDTILKSKVKPGAGSGSKDKQAPKSTQGPTDPLGKIAAGLSGLNIMTNSGVLG